MKKKAENITAQIKTLFSAAPIIIFPTAGPAVLVPSIRVMGHHNPFKLMTRFSFYLKKNGLQTNSFFVFYKVYPCVLNKPWFHLNISIGFERSSLIRKSPDE